jgi:hypothetical protein
MTGYASFAFRSVTLATLLQKGRELAQKPQFCVGLLANWWRLT